MSLIKSDELLKILAERREIIAAQMGEAKTTYELVALEARAEESKEISQLILTQAARGWETITVGNVQTIPFDVVEDMNRLDSYHHKQLMAERTTRQLIDEIILRGLLMERTEDDPQLMQRVYRTWLNIVVPKREFEVSE